MPVASILSLDISSQPFASRWQAIAQSIQHLVPWINYWELSEAGSVAHAYASRRSSRRYSPNGNPVVQINWIGAEPHLQSVVIAGEDHQGLTAQLTIAIGLLDLNDIAPVVPDQHQQLKRRQVDALREILPPSTNVRTMLDVWIAIDQRYWGAALTPCWLSSNIEPYGKAIGSWAPQARTLNLVPQLFRGTDPTAPVRGVMAHEAAHQAQSQLYRHFDQAKGPRGRWFDTSHRCPSWSRALWDIICRDGTDAFAPVYHRSSGNQWHAWIPDSPDWSTWRKAKPDDTYQGRQLLSFDDVRHYAPALSKNQLLTHVQRNTAPGEPVPDSNWGI